MKKTLTTTQTGCLTDPATFGGSEFTDGDNLDVRHALIVDRDATVGSVTVTRRGTVNIEANLTVQGNAEIYGFVYQLAGSLVAFDSAYHENPDAGLTVRLLGKRAEWRAEGTAEKNCHLWSSSHGGFAHFVSTPRPISEAVTLIFADAVDVLGLTLATVIAGNTTRTHKHQCRATAHRKPRPRPFSVRRLLVKAVSLGTFGH